MYPFGQPKWTLLREEEEESQPDRQTQQRSRPDNTKLLRALCILAIFVTLTLPGILTSIILSRSGFDHRRCVQYTSSWSPALEAVYGADGYRSRIFNGSTNFPSPYKGPPSQAVDDAWAQIDQMDAITLSEQEVRKLGKDPELAVQIPTEFGGGYLGTIEVVHQLHCLHLLWQATHMEYYDELHSALGTDREPALRNHLDHCADILRQNLQCTADVGFITYVWLPGRPIPYPDFNTDHRCRNYDAVMAWAKEREVPLFAGGQFTRTAGSPTVPTPP